MSILSTLNITWELYNLKYSNHIEKWDETEINFNNKFYTIYPTWNSIQDVIPKEKFNEVKAKC